AADPAHQRVGTPGFGWLVFQHPFIRPGPAGLHRGLGRLINPGGHERVVSLQAGMRSAWSGRPDSNRRPRVPKTRALTRLRHAPTLRPEAMRAGVPAQETLIPAQRRPADQPAPPKIGACTLSPTRISSFAVMPPCSSSVARTGPWLSITARLSGTVFSAMWRIVPSWLMKTMSSGTSVFFI